MGLMSDHIFIQFESQLQKVWKIRTANTKPTYSQSLCPHKNVNLPSKIGQMVSSYVQEGALNEKEIEWSTTSNMPE